MTILLEVVLNLDLGFHSDPIMLPRTEIIKTLKMKICNFEFFVIVAGTLCNFCTATRYS